MSLQLATISMSGGQILCESGLAGPHRTIVTKVLEKIPRHDNRMSYTYESNVIHYSVENEIVYLCMADKDVQSRIAFAFLEEVQRRFKEKFAGSERKYPATNDLSKETCQKFNVILTEQLKYFNDPNSDKVTRVRRQIADVQQVMLENIDAVLARGDQIDNLVDKTNELNTQAEGFRTQSRTLRRKMQWKNVKLVLAILLALGVLGIIIGMIACHPDFKGCQTQTPDSPPPAPPGPAPATPAPTPAGTAAPTASPSGSTPPAVPTTPAPTPTPVGTTGAPTGTTANPVPVGSTTTSPVSTTTAPVGTTPPPPTIAPITTPASMPVTPASTAIPPIPLPTSL
eukprot:PhF_6_TR3691/c0_g1_i1/m.5249/K08515/VAMP7; vesicle-associated membrane protein 7